MACKTTFELHHNFPKLAEESGFTFNTHKPKVHIEWRKIKLIDIENVIRDRKFSTVEQHINDILDCVLESEFDVRILDEGVLKIFRLAQLAVEYQQFCRHYLDRSVFVLREEVTNLMQELDLTKRNLREKEEENKKVRKKSKHFARTPLPYGNENIATMILKTLNQSRGDIFNSTPQLDAIQYNKCNYCEKVFLNQLYLKGHISRRHGNVLELPQRDITDNHPTTDNTNEKLNNEISELKLKLKEMEDLIEKSQHFCNPTKEQALPAEVTSLNVKTTEHVAIENKEIKDPEISTNDEGFILEKIEEWKKEEHDKYNEEIKLLRQQITDIINSKQKQDQTSIKNEFKIIEELHTTIKVQGEEISTLKCKLLNEESTQVEKRKEIEAQMSYWAKQAEIQSNEYKSLLQKLNEVANEAKEFRAQAQKEKEKSEHLQLLLQKQQNKSSPEHSHAKIKSNVIEDQVEIAKVEHEPVKTKITHKSPTADVLTLKKLQQKAQELLNIDQSSSSDNSNTSDVKFKLTTKRNKEDNKVSNKNKQKYDNKLNQTILPRSKKNFQSYEKSDNVQTKTIEGKKSKNKTKNDSHQPKKENGCAHIPASPIKVVRAKITEEVNNRLISLGVDPLKNRIPENIFRKQRKLLQELQQAKTKKTPSREKILHSIMTHLDQNTSSTSYAQENNYVSPNKYPKGFSLSSVLSNVKTKALSLVKSNESSVKHIKSHDEVAKTAIALLKTPPESINSSPVMQRRASVALSNNNGRNVSVEKKSTKKSRMIIRNNNKRPEEYNEESTESSDETESNTDEDQQNLDSTSKVINSLIKSPARRPTDSDTIDGNRSKYKSEFISASTTEDINKHLYMEKDKNSSDDVESIKDTSPKKNTSFENISSPKHSKGVLKNASSTSSLNKKKVLFDMDAIQMKSVSASPSQSITDKSDKNEQYELGIVNLDTEEWDISSIENEPLKSTTKIQLSTRTSPKIAELKQTIESQLTRRNPKLSTAIIGGVDVLATPKPIQKASFGGSNTSLGSSILDDDSTPIVKPKKVTEKDDSEIEISDLIADTMVNKSYNKTF